MYHGGTTASGYGGVFRTYPQAQAQQVPSSPRARVTAPAAAFTPPWTIAARNWAAESAAQLALYLASQGHVIGMGGENALYPFPSPGQWWAHRFDAPDATVAIRNLLRALGIRPVVPAPPPPVPFPSPNVTAALFASQEALYLAFPPSFHIADAAVRFPELGQWQPQPLPFDRAYYSLRQRLLAIVNPPSLPFTVAPWIAELGNWAALDATLGALILGRLEALAPPPPPPVASIAAGMVDNWAAFNYAQETLLLARPETRPPEFLPPSPPWLDELGHEAPLFWAGVELRLARREAKPDEGSILTPAWDAELANQAALEASGPVLYLPRREWKGADQQPATPAWAAELDAFAPLFWTSPTVALARLEAKPGEPPQPTPSWAAELDSLAALMWAPALTLLARREVKGAEQQAATAAWLAELAHTAPLMASAAALFLERLDRQPTEVVSVTPAWGTELRQAAALMHAEAAISLARIETSPTPPPPSLFPSWRASRDGWAALGALQEVLYAVTKAYGPTAEAAQLLQAWEKTRALWPALGAVSEVLALVQPAPQPFSPLALPPPRAWPWLLMQPPSAAAIWAQFRLPHFPFLSVVLTSRGLVGVTVTNLRADAVPMPPWLAGLVEETDPKLLLPGSIADGENFTPQRNPRLAARGGSRILLTLHDDVGAAELTNVLAGPPKAATGAVLIGHSSVTSKHYAYAVTSDLAFAGASEALSRTAFPAAWNHATPGRPVTANLFEKLYVADATVAYGSRYPLAVIDSVIPPAITVPTFAFAGGGPQGLFCYCLEEYNNVLFIAGYGDEGVGTGDDPALVRHSFLGVAPDAGGGFDKDAYNTLGAKGDRVTAMRKGRGLLLIAKANELYRLSGAGRAYPGWQYQVEGVQNTLGLGVENPLALEHAEGFWYGIGKQGPFRTDGFAVESLVGPRQRTWAGVDQLGTAWVRYHPQRRLVLFGVHVTAGAPDATYPWVLMAWDCEREVWQPNWKLATPTSLFTAQAVATATAQGPSAPPSVPVTTLQTTEGWTSSWTTGDAAAETELWIANVTDGGAYSLYSVVSPGTATKLVLSQINHKQYKWKARHRRNGVFSDYCAESLLSTKILPPSWGATCDPPPAVSIAEIHVTPRNKGGTHTLQVGPSNVGPWTTIDVRASDVTYDVAYATGGVAHFFQVMTHDGAWLYPDSDWSTPQAPVSC